jgi:putative nucleotidyltransferase with HDIG domain
LSDEENEIIYRAALLHDIGKIGISDNILNKKGTLEHREFVIIRQHPDTAVRILSNLKFVQKYIPYIKYHHEWYNGNGYPEGLSGENIPIGAKILAVADAFDAMTSDRPYREGMSVDAALDILNSGSGSQWDAKIVQALMDCKQTFS